MATKRKCVCCGKEYEFCPNCLKMAHPTWMTTFDCEECKELFNIVSAYNTGFISKAKVQAFVAAHNITDYTKYSEPIRKVLEATKPIIKTEPAKTESVVKVTVAESVIKPPIVKEPAQNGEASFSENEPSPIVETKVNEANAQSPIKARTHRKKKRVGY